ncbi:PTS transporter subunit EIIB [Aeromonas hydrophila]
MAKITDTMVGQLIQAIGGRDNITHCGHCMTRLRLSLADSLHADRDTIKRIAGVMGVIESDDQFQIVLGPGKAQTACELMNGMLSAGSAHWRRQPPNPPIWARSPPPRNRR